MMGNHFLLVPTDIDTKDYKNLNEDYDNLIEELKYTRGNFIEIIVEIENRIDTFILGLFHPRDEKLIKIFERKYNNNNLETKIDLFVEIIKAKEFLSLEELKELKKNLDVLRVERNRWAHGLIHFEVRKEKDYFLVPSLLYINFKGVRKSDYLDDEYYENAEKRLKKVSEFLDSTLMKANFLNEDGSMNSEFQDELFEKFRERND